MLSRPPVRFTGLQARAVGRGFAHYVERSDCVIYACAILPDHVHMVIARHRYSIEQVSNLLKGAATSRLTQENLHPFQHDPYQNGKLPTPWTRTSWKVFLNCENDICRAVRYVEDNPLKETRQRQKWRFVVSYREV